MINTKLRIDGDDEFAIFGNTTLPSVPTPSPEGTLVIVYESITYIIRGVEYDCSDNSMTLDVEKED